MRSLSAAGLCVPVGIGTRYDEYEYEVCNSNVAMVLFPETAIACGPWPDTKCTADFARRVSSCRANWCLQSLPGASRIYEYYCAALNPTCPLKICYIFHMVLVCGEAVMSECLSRNRKELSLTTAPVCLLCTPCTLLTNIHTRLRRSSGQAATPACASPRFTRATAAHCHWIWQQCKAVWIFLNLECAMGDASWNLNFAETSMGDVSGLWPPFTENVYCACN